MKRLGRPPLDPADPSVRVCIAIPGKHYDGLYKRAAGERLTVPEFIRRALHQATEKSNTKGTR